MTLWAVTAPVLTTSWGKSLCLQSKRDSSVLMVSCDEHRVLLTLRLCWSSLTLTGCWPRRNAVSNKITIFVYLCVLLFSDKKCTYGIKCKFYHPERVNQSYLSLADELREKAQISSAREDRNSRSSPRQLQSNSGPVHNAGPYPQESNREHVIDQQSAPHLIQVSENKPLYWGDPRNSTNHTPCSVPGDQCQTEWPGLHSSPNPYYAHIPHEYLDSGLGSYESLYSDVSHCPSSSHRLMPQQQSALTGPRNVSVHLDKSNSSQTCRGCSHEQPSTAHNQHHRNLDSNGQIKCDNFPPHMLPPGNHNSLLSHLQYSGAPDHQQSYWSDPYQALPQARTRCSLPTSVHSSLPNEFRCSCTCQQYHSWGQQQLFPAAFDPQRLELRKKLHAIFNPHQVDTIMEMFPHLTNAEKLAAEILNLKTQSGIFWSFLLISASCLVLANRICWEASYVGWLNSYFLCAIMDVQLAFNLIKNTLFRMWCMSETSLSNVTLSSMFRMNRAFRPKKKGKLSFFWGFSCWCILCQMWF